MSPGATGAVYDALGKMLVTRADVDALDLMGWNVNPGALNLVAGDGIDLLAPTAGYAARPNQDLVFEWNTNRSTPDGWALFIYEGLEAVDDMPYRVYDNLDQMEFTITSAEPLPPGEYVWYVVGSLGLGYETSVERRLTILCTADFDASGFVDTDDFDAFISAFEGGSENADVNGSGFVDTDDFDFFVSAYENGC